MRLKKANAVLKEGKKKPSLRDRLTKKYGITEFGPGSIGLNVDKGICYGWSHRAICGFKVGDKIYDENFKGAGDNTSFKKHGDKTIKTIEDAKKAATNFAGSVG